MTNYSFEPPAKKAMDEAELSELISGLSADESGIEKAMKILQEQETLRVEDQRNFDAWRQALINDGSVEALKAVEKVTGEVLIEPDPEPEPEAEPEPQLETLEEVTEPEAATVEPQAVIDNELSETTEEINIPEESVRATVEVIQESVSITQEDGNLEIDYQSVTVSTELRRVTPADSLQDALASAVNQPPKKIRQFLSSKAVLGASLAASVFALLVIGQIAILPSNPWASVGTLVGVILGFGLFVAHGFQKEGFASLVSKRLHALGVYWQAALLLGVSLTVIAVSNLARDNRLFVDLAVSPAKIVDYRIDEITLVVLTAVLFATVLAWQPMLRFGLLRLFAVVGLVSIGLVLSGLESNETAFGDFDALAFVAGAILAFVVTVVLGIVLQPSFAASHERPSWAVGEFNTRRGRVATLHGFLFIFLPGLLAFIFGLADIAMGNTSELAQTGLLIGAGIALMVTLVGIFDHSNVYFKLVALALIAAGLVSGEYLVNDWVEGLSTIGLLLLVTSAGSGLVIRFFADEVQNGWLALVGIVLGGAVGWLIENPFGLLDLGFEGYSDIQGYGLGFIAAVFVSAIISLGTIGKAKADENS